MGDCRLCAGHHVGRQAREDKLPVLLIAGPSLDRREGSYVSREVCISKQRVDQKEARVAPSPVGGSGKASWKGRLSTRISLQRWTELAKPTMGKIASHPECQALTTAGRCEMPRGSGNNKKVNSSSCGYLTVLSPFYFYSQNAITFYFQYLISDVKKLNIGLFCFVLAYCFNPPLLLRALQIPLNTGKCPKEKHKDEYFTVL